MDKKSLSERIEHRLTRYSIFMAWPISPKDLALVAEVAALEAPPWVDVNERLEVLERVAIAARRKAECDIGGWCGQCDGELDSALIEYGHLPPAPEQP